MKKIRTFGICALILVWALLAVALWFGPKEEYTNAERRPLMQLPQISANSAANSQVILRTSPLTSSLYEILSGNSNLSSTIMF